MGTNDAALIAQIQTRLLELEAELKEVKESLGEATQNLSQVGSGNGGGGGEGPLRGVTVADIASGSSGDVTVYDDSGSPTARVETANLWLSGTVFAGTPVYIQQVGSGYDVVQADCP